MLSSVKTFVRRLWGKRTSVGSASVINLQIPSVQPPLKIVVHEDEGELISKAIKESGIWEPLETDIVLELVSEGDVFVDVGANIGYFSILASRCVGSDGKVFAFEPEDTNYALLMNNIELNRIQNVLATPVALSNNNHKAKLYLNLTNRGDHKLHPSKFEVPDSAVRVRLAKGEDVLPKDQRVDFLKIDTQGSEAHVLEGLQRVIKRSFPDITVLFELSPNALHQAGASGLNLIDELAQQGFQFLVIHGERLLHSRPNILKGWIGITRLDNSDEGFLNIVCISSKKLDNLSSGSIQLTDDSNAEVIFGDIVQPWRGSKATLADIGRHVLTLGWTLDNKMPNSGANIYFRPVVDGSGKPITLIIEGRFEGNLFDFDVYVNDKKVGIMYANKLCCVIPSESFESGSVFVSLLPRNREGVSSFELKSVSFDV